VFFSFKVRFPVSKANKGKTNDQGAVAAVAVAEKDPDVERLEQQCYTDLVECCRNLAQAAGVNYTTIMNLEVFS
jgi:uncharacterized protein YuzB (UPF0349 family)